ncbi:MAG: hypothetical protein IJH70_13145 [Oscillospiraceae bacterium]|nr:hypothetical protein [Oscillospiraceae bacterium]
MTNAMIIFNESVKLMEAGKIRGTGRFVEVEDQNGNKQQLELPEASTLTTHGKSLVFRCRRDRKPLLSLPSGSMQPGSTPKQKQMEPQKRHWGECS